MRSVLGSLKALPIEQVEQYLGEQIAVLRRDKKRPNSLHMAMSLAEYLKDARRWQYLQNNIVDLPRGISPEGIRRYIDEQLEKLGG